MNRRTIGSRTTVGKIRFSLSPPVFVFKPSEPRPLFSHKAVCSGRVSRAVFAPREETLESCEESSQWLNRSQLCFLTQNMVNMDSCLRFTDRCLCSYQCAVGGPWLN